MLLTAGPFTVVTPSGRTILDGDSLVLGDGELVVLEAPSGRGKSTLLRCVAGIIGGADANRVLRGDHFSGRRLPVWRCQGGVLGPEAPALPGAVGGKLGFSLPLRGGGGGWVCGRPAGPGRGESGLARRAAARGAHTG